MTTMLRSLLLALLFAAAASAQSSSLFLDVEPAAPMHAPGSPGRFSPARERALPPTVAAFSFTAVAPPRPRYFAVNDLVTIIVRQSTTARIASSLDTEKKSEFKGQISDFPNFDLAKLLQFQLQASKNQNPPKVGINFDNKFEGEGDYETRNDITMRITARVIDVKPNGTLVLEARSLEQSDDEVLDVVITGTCRAEDIGIDNTVLSTQLYGLNLVKKHDGELRKTTKKGVLTKLFDFLFAF